MGEGMDDDTWEEITGHARKCALPGHKVYAYSAAHATIYVTSIFDLVKVEFDGMVPLQKLHEVQKRLVQQLMREAYEHRHSLQKVELTWKLAFKSPLRLPIHTGSRITDATGNPLEIILVDARTGSPLQFPMELLEITVAPLLGDFPPYDGKEDWSAEEFEAAIVRPRTRHLDLPLLKSDLVFKKEDGRVTVDELQFTDDSSWVRCRKFRIGAYVVLGGRYDGEFRIVEAMTEAFEVHDLNRKHYPPARSDPVWRLEMIDKDGAFHRELTRNNIDTVQEFHSMLMLKPNELRAIVGDGMTDGMWVWTTSHAMECDPGDKVYAYNGSHGTIYVDSIFRRLLKQIVIDGVECQLPWQPDKAQTMLVRQLLLEAYEHRHNLHEVVDAAMELSYDNTIELEYLLSRAQRYDGDNDDGGNRAQPLVHHDEVTVPQATNLVHHGPSQTESGSDS